MCSMMQTRVKARGSDPKCPSAQCGREHVIVMFAGGFPPVDCRQDGYSDDAQTWSPHDSAAARALRHMSSWWQHVAFCVLGYFVQVSTAHDASWLAPEVHQLLRYKVCTNFPMMCQIICTKWTADPVGTAAWPLGIMTRSCSEASRDLLCFTYCELSRTYGMLCDLRVGRQTTTLLNSQWWKACKFDESPMLATCRRPEDLGTDAPLFQELGMQIHLV